jgi:predicted thioesterase
MLKVGITGTQERTVTQELTAEAMGSGELPVFATPAVIALAEETAWKSVAPYLEEGQGTVGTVMDLSHIAATPLGMQVRCESELVEIDRRRLVFLVKVYDEKEKVAEGRHERFIVDNAKFLAKAESKRL